jgi:hypothetical protein
LREKPLGPAGLWNRHDYNRRRGGFAHFGEGVYTRYFVKSFPLCHDDELPGARITGGWRKHRDFQKLF